jgi:hypothetical protein
MNEASDSPTPLLPSKSNSSKNVYGVSTSRDGRTTAGSETASRASSPNKELTVPSSPSMARRQSKANSTSATKMNDLLSTIPGTRRPSKFSGPIPTSEKNASSQPSKSHNLSTSLNNLAKKNQERKQVEKKEYEDALERIIQRTFYDDDSVYVKLNQSKEKDKAQRCYQVPSKEIQRRVAESILRTETSRKQQKQEKAEKERFLTERKERDLIRCIEAPKQSRLRIKERHQRVKEALVRGHRLFNGRKLKQLLFF